MRLIVLPLLLVSASLALLTATAGCREKVTTVERSERIEVSEPRMVSPGREVVE